jgi:hypothetical protein
MNDWADNVAARLKQRKQNQELKNAKFVEQQRIKRTKGEPLWQQVRDDVCQKCDALNKKIGEDTLRFEEGREFTFSVWSKVEGKSRHLSAKYDSETCTLWWGCEGTSDSLEVLVLDDGGACFGSGMEIPSTPSSIAQQMLNALLGLN